MNTNSSVYIKQKIANNYTSVTKLSGVRASSVFPRSSAYTPCVCYLYYSGSETWTLIQADWKRLDSFHLHCQRRVLHNSWHDFVSNDEVLHRTSLFDVSYIICKQRLGLFGHVARLRSDVLANSILRICAKMRDGERPSQEWRRTCGRPSTTWVHQICRDTGVSATEALLLAEDKRSGERSKRREAAADRYASWLIDWLSNKANAW